VWVFTWTSKGKRRDMGLGSYGNDGGRVSLSQARAMAEEQRKLVAQGRDPIAERIAERNAARVEQRRLAASELTFGQCADKLFADLSVDWRHPKHRQQWTNSVRNHAATLRDLPIAAIETADVLAVVEPIWRTKPITAHRVRSRIETVLDWAKARGYRQGDNPARWRGHLKTLLPKSGLASRNYPAMAVDEVPGFVARLRQKQAITAQALEFLILTAARSAEVTGMLWDEVDLRDRAWTVPGSRMKSGRKHRVPLSDRAVAILGALERLPDNPHVFPGGKQGKGLGPRALLAALARMQESVTQESVTQESVTQESVTVHGFRSSFRTWAAERTNYPREICEVALAHAVGDETERAYQRADLLAKRRRLMEQWSAFCRSKPRSKSGNVLPLRQVAR
jgi:integrase